MDQIVNLAMFTMDRTVTQSFASLSLFVPGLWMGAVCVMLGPGRGRVSLCVWAGGVAMRQGGKGGQSPAAGPRVKGTTSHTHTFNGPFSGTTRVSRYQKGNRFGFY